MRAALFFPSLLVCILASAQTPKNALLSPYVKAVTYSNGFSDALSYTNNEAALAQVKSFSAGVYGEKKYLIDGLNQFSGSLAWPTKSGVFGGQLHQFGNSDYAQSQLGLAYARKLFDKLDVGALFHYNSFRVSGYGNASVVNVEAGAVVHITDQLNAGLHVANPYASRFGKYKEERLTSVYSLGLGYDAGDMFYIGAEVNKTESLPLDFNASIHYKLSERIHARGGMSSSTALMFFGLGIQVDQIRFDVIASIHQQLGFSPGIAIIFNQNRQVEQSR